MKTQQRKNELEHARLLLHVRAVQLDRGNADEVLKFNERFEDYVALYEPAYKVKKRESYEDKAKVLEDFKKNFTVKFATKNKLKNFEKAQADHGRNH